MTSEDATVGTVEVDVIPKDSDSPKPQVKMVLGVVFLGYLGLMTLTPVIAPLSREIHMPEWQVGVTISVAAVMVVIGSQFWGRRSQSWGCKRVLVSAMLMASFSMLCFVIVSQLGMDHMVTGVILFALFILFRGVIFGAAISAIGPSAQVYITKVTSTESERVKGMAAVGAVQGIAMVGGALVGGALAGISLMLSLGVVPVLLFAGALLMLFGLRKEPAASLIPKPPFISPFDTRVWPFLVAGFGMFSGLGFIQVISGFIVQDRFKLNAEMTGLVTGLSLLACGIGVIVAQSLIVPRSNWRPVTMLRVGSLIATIGFVMLVIEAGYVLYFSSMLVIALGIGIAMPGYTAGSTLLMKPEEQGGLAGLVAGTNGLTFVIAPTASTALYGLWPNLPIMVGGFITLFVFIFVMLHPRLRQLASKDRVL